MYNDYQFAALAEEDQQKLVALEHDLGQKYGREVILIAYEKPSESDAATQGASPGATQMEVGRLGVDSNKRGPTFGYADAHGDHYPTLGLLMNERIAEGEDIRFSDAEPPNRDEKKKKK